MKSSRVLISFALAASQLSVAFAAAPTPNPSHSPQACAPAGFVYSQGVGSRNNTRLTRGAIEYCVAEGGLFSGCEKWGGPDAFVQKESGRPDAVYSGMAVRANSQLILFYCLPKD